MKNYSKIVNEHLSLEPDIAYRRRAGIIFKELELEENNSILEIGCGRGFYLEVLSEISNNFKITGVDINEKYLNYAAKIIPKGVHLIKADATKLPFKDNSFDKIICSELLEHVTNDLAVLNEIKRVLKSNGICLITVPNKNYPFLWDPLNWILEKLFNRHIPSNIWWLAGIWADHLRLYVKSDLLNKIKNSSLKINKLWLTTTYCLPFNHFLLYGIGKNLVEKGLLNSFNRFNKKNNKSIITKFFLFPIISVDNWLNKDDDLNQCSVNFVIKCKKCKKIT